MNETLKPQPRAQLIALRDALLDLRADADAAYKAASTGQKRGPVTGLPKLDREISHVLAPGLHGFYGNTGSGKTALTMQIATSCGFPALYVTTEMGVAELLRRHTARVTKTFLGRLKSGELTGAQVQELAQIAINAAPDFCFLDATCAPALPVQLRECALQARGKAPHVLIVIDSLQTWAGAVEPAAPEYEAINTAIASLTQIAQELRAPILFTSERNRESNKEGKSGVNAGAGSRKIEYSSETVFDLDRKMGDQPNGAGEHEVTLRIVKNRHGSLGVPIQLLFNGALQQFRESEVRTKSNSAN